MNYPANCKYALLITSLPSHKNSLFDEKHTPLSRIQLDKRLALLDEKDASDLLKIEGLLHWPQIKNEIDSTFVDETLSSIASIDNDFIKNIIIWRLELRIILAALRMRNQGLKQAPDEKLFGFDSWHFYISNYWHEADFGLSQRLPWVAKVNELLLAGKSFQLEELLLSIVWEHYQRQSLGHYFDFEAVIIYVLRRDMISRWSGNDKTLALTRFNHLLDSGLQQIDL